MRVYGSRLLFDSHHCLNNDGVQAVPLRRVQSCCRYQSGCPPSGTCFVSPSGQQGRQQQHREQIGQDQAAAGRQHPGALGQPGPLVRPVIERGRADHQVEGGCGPGQLLGGCTQPAGACEVHHTKHKAYGGKTSVKDCVLLCPFHHQVVIHRWGWTLVVNPDGTTTAWNKNKTKVLHSHGPPARAG